MLAAIAVAAHAAMVCGSGASAQPQIEPNHIYDFLVMDVCVDDRDRIMPALSPADQGCTRRRDIKAGEPIPYHMHNFPRSNGPCKFRLGTISKDHFPVTKNSVTRVVSYYDKGVDRGCSGVQPNEPSFGKDDPNEGGSVQWYDDKYGFTMGSWSPVASSVFQTPSCSSYPDSSRQFFRGWIIAPAQVPSKNEAPGYGVFESKLFKGTAAAAFARCPASYNRYLATWVRGDFTYRSGLRLDSIVSSHYSRANAAGTSPGASMQMERTYWTREFGLARWEKWAREDWIHPRSGKRVPDLAGAVRLSNSCSKPYDMPEKVSAGLEFGPVSAEGGYSQIVRDTTTSQQYRWHVTICEDYTNIVKDSGGGLVAKWGDHIDNSYWRP
jgi:hypothetical protein